MQERTYTVKGMVCNRCISFVKEAMASLGVQVLKADLGSVTLLAASATPESTIEKKLSALGFGLLKDPDTLLGAKVQSLMAEVYSGRFDFPYNFRFSTYAAECLATSPDALNEAIKKAHRMSLEKFVLSFRIDKAKELLVYTSLTLADISFALGFSSVSHLSKQFKSMTGLNPSHFKAVQASKQTAANADNYIKDEADSITGSGKAE